MYCNKMLFYKILIVCLTIFLCLFFPFQDGNAQNIGINTENPDNSAILEVYSTTKGVLIPRLTNSERDNIPSPAISLIIYNNDTGKFNYWNGSNWEYINDKYVSSESGNGTPDHGGVAVNNADTPPDLSAMLDICSTGDNKKGLLIPRTISSNVNNPVQGLLIYDTNLNKYCLYDGDTWQSFCHEYLSDSIGNGNYISDGTGINTTSVDASARLEIESTNKGVLIPRLSETHRDNINSPANGLMIYNITAKSIDVYTGSEWRQLMYDVPSQPASINGNTNVCEDTTGETYNISPVNGATGYEWTVPEDASIINGQGTTNITVDFGFISGNICVSATNGCGSSPPLCISIDVTDCTEQSPCAGYEGNTYEFEIVYGGDTYKLVEIGEQCWFAEGLRYDNGCSSVTWDNTADVGWCGCYNSDCATYLEPYGMLYQWSAAMDGSTTEGAQGICPDGFHIPADNEIKILEMELGMTQQETDETGYRGTNQGAQLAGTISLWDNGVLTSSPVFGATEFNVLPSGSRGITTGYYYHLNTRGHFLSSTETDSSNKWHRSIRASETGIGRFDYSKTTPINVRCLRD